MKPLTLGSGHTQPSHKLDKNWRPRHWGTGSPYNDAQVSKVSKPITDEGEFKRRTGKPTDPTAAFFGTNHVYHGMSEAEAVYPCELKEGPPEFPWTNVRNNERKGTPKLAIMKKAQEWTNQHIREKSVHNLRGRKRVREDIDPLRRRGRPRSKMRQHATGNGHSGNCLSEAIRLKVCGPNMLSTSFQAFSERVQSRSERSRDGLSAWLSWEGM